MKLKGNWVSTEKYSVGNVVRHTDGEFYHLQKPCEVGVAPVDTRYWGKVSQVTAEAASLIMDAIDIANSDDPANVSDNAIVLNSSTEGSEKQFIITVDDDGEITATEIEEEGES